MRCAKANRQRCQVFVCPKKTGTKVDENTTIAKTHGATMHIRDWRMRAGVQSGRMRMAIKMILKREHRFISIIWFKRRRGIAVAGTVPGK